MPQELTLPDGRVLVIPDNITLDQRVALRNKLGSQYADIKTGRGMQERANQQAQTAVRRPLDQLQERETAYSMFTPTGVSGPPGDPEVERTRRAADVSADVVGGMTAIPGAAGSIAEQGLKGALKSGLKTAVRTGVGATGGAYAGGKAGKYLGGDTGETVGKIAGGALGGYAGATGNPAAGRMLPGGFMSRMVEAMGGGAEAAPAETLAARTGAAAGGVPVVPEPRAPFPGENPGYMASVPREQLPELAAQGKPGAALQQQQLGSTQLYEPRGGTGYPPPRSSTAFPERVAAQAPAAAPTSPVGESESFTERMRRRAPGQSPTTKSVQRHYNKTREDE